MACTGIIYDPGGDPTDAGNAGADASVDARVDASVDAAPVAFTVTATAFESGSIEPAGALSVIPGGTLTFGLTPRITPCNVTVTGTCGGVLNGAGDQYETAPVTADCSVIATFDCGASHLELRPENVGVFWENPTQQFTATQVFESTSERVDVTALFDWSSSDGAAVSVDAAGLATALADHGVVTIAASDPAASTPLVAETTLTVVHVTEWRYGVQNISLWETGQVYLDNVNFTRSDPNNQATTVIHWDWSPRPWVQHDNGICGLVWSVWSYDGGLTYIAQAWDYIGNATSTKGIGGGCADVWLGTMVSTICHATNPCYDPGCPAEFYCSGTQRSNLYFATYPYTPNTSL